MILAGAILMWAPSCKNPLDYTPEGAEDALLLNALFSASETTHTVYLGISKMDVLDSIKSGSVWCSVNGTEYPLTQRKPVNSLLQSEFYFDAPLSEGDNVTITASADGYSASTSAIVPEKPTISDIDTSWYEISAVLIDTLLSYRLLECDVFIDDDGTLGRNYAMEMHFNYVVDTLSPSGMVVGVDSGRRLCQGVYYTSKSLAEQGGMYRLLVDTRHFSPRDTIAQVMNVRGYLSVELSVVDQDSFYYMQATNGILDSYLIQGIKNAVLPQNVEGGYGYFGMRNPDCRYFTLPDQIIDTTPVPEEDDDGSEDASDKYKQ